MHVRTRVWSPNPPPTRERFRSTEPGVISPEHKCRKSPGTLAVVTPKMTILRRQVTLLTAATLRNPYQQPARSEHVPLPRISPIFQCFQARLGCYLGVRPWGALGTRREAGDRSACARCTEDKGTTDCATPRSLALWGPSAGRANARRPCYLSGPPSGSPSYPVNEMRRLRTPSQGWGGKGP